MGIGNRIYDWVEDVAVSWGDRLSMWLGRSAGKATKSGLSAIDPDLLAALNRAAKTALDSAHSLSARSILAGGSPTAPNPQPAIGDLPATPLIVQDPLLVIEATVGSVTGGILGLFPSALAVATAGPIQQRVNLANDMYRATPLDPQAAIKAAWHSDRYALMPGAEGAKAGLSNERISALRESLRPILDAGEVRDLWLRGQLSDIQVAERLGQMGYEGATMADLRKLWLRIPPVQDIIRMAVREAFTPDIAAKFGQYEDYPAAVTEHARSAGLTEDWAKRYWAAHWDLPSVGQGMEMLHRGKITSADLDMLLRALDVMPFWRDKLKSIAYNPLTRVDVRRMYGLGVLDRAGVKRSYLDLGYSEIDAERMTEFTVRYESQADRDLTKAEIVKALRSRTINEDTAREYLIDLGYSADDADFVLQSESVSAAASERDLSETKLKQLYLTGLMPRAEVTAELAASGYSASEIAYTLQLWDLTWESSITQPSRSELTHFLGLGIISESEFTTEMADIGYGVKHTGWYLSEYQSDQLAESQAAAEAAEKEATRIAKAAKSTEYDKSRSAIDVQIAQVRVTIADAQASLLRIGTTTEQVTLRSLAESLRQSLSRLSLEAQQSIADMALDLRIASRGATDEEKSVIERATLDQQQALALATDTERNTIHLLALQEQEQVRAEVSAARDELRLTIATAQAEIARLNLAKAQLKLTYA